MSETRRARPMLRWLLIGGSLVLVAALASMALAIWNRGRVLQARLRDLHVSRSALTDVGVRRLTALSRLARLDVSDRPLSRETLRGFAKCRELRDLWILNTGADEETIAFLKRELPACRIVDDEVAAQQGNR